MTGVSTTVGLSTVTIMLDGTPEAQARVVPSSFLPGLAFSAGKAFLPVGPSMNGRAWGYLVDE